MGFAKSSLLKRGYSYLLEQCCATFIAWLCCWGRFKNYVDNIIYTEQKQKGFLLKKFVQTGPKFFWFCSSVKYWICTKRNITEGSAWFYICGRYVSKSTQSGQKSLEPCQRSFWMTPYGMQYAYNAQALRLYLLW